MIAVDYRGLAGKRFVVVEDEPLIAMTLESALIDAGATVLGIAGTVKIALSMLAEQQPDAVTLDANLEGEMTSEVARTLRARAVPTLLVTGYSQSILADQDLSPLPRLTKPFTIGALLAAVRRLWPA